MTIGSALSDTSHTLDAARADRPRADVWSSLEAVCKKSGLDDLAGRLGELRPWLEGDLGIVEAALAEVGTGGDTLAHKTARHLLDLSGKRLRPMCVALSSRVGQGFGRGARELAVAVELVHAATLLHDDVVDVGDRRRGVPAARVVYGNAASIFGGDWLLCEALCRVQASAVPDVLDRMLAVIKEMVVAESLQLARRGVPSLDRQAYFRVIRGKTAALFAWATFAGGRAGGVDARGCQALSDFGDKLGVAFQIVDDVLDVAGDPSSTGKSLLSDLGEGKMTFPLIVAAERDATLGARIADVAAAAAEGEADPAALAEIARALPRVGAVETSFEMALDLSRQAAESLAPIPPGLARSALEAVALAAVRRTK